MKREDIFRSVTGLIAGIAALATCGALLMLARSWWYAAGSTLAVVLYLIFGAQETYLTPVLAGAAVLAGGLAFFVLVRNANRLPAAVLQAAVLGVIVACGVVASTVVTWLATTPDWQDQVSASRLWLTDRTPPTLSLICPTPAVRGDAMIGVFLNDEQEATITSVSVDGKALPPVWPVAVGTAQLADGAHTVVIEAEDASYRRNTVQESCTFSSETQWWTTDVTPPVITLTVPISIVKGLVSIGMETSDQGAHRVVSYTLDGMTLPFSRSLTVDTATFADGVHTLILEAQDDSRQANRSLAKATFRTDNLPPTITVRFDPATATQGHTQFVYVTTSEPVAAITATLGGQPLALVQGTSSYWAVLGFAADAKTGSSALSVRVADQMGNAGQITATQAITRFTFPVENVTGEDIALPADRASLLDYGPAETAYLDTVFAPVTTDQLWQGAFTAPVKGRQTSAFAIRRSYNGGALGSYHGGVDIAANEGVAVAAANRGRVVLAEGLKVRGHAICLDHGMGVYTCYYHLSQIKVQKGQVVEKGQIIGLVGNEGVSTGPHLHWEMRVTGYAVDPWPWTQRAYP